MKRFLTLTLALASIFILSSCGAFSHKFNPVESGLYIKKDGTFKSALIGELDKEQYTSEGLKEFAQNEVNEYNNKTGTEGVILEKASVKDGKAELIFSYSNTLALLEFAHDSQDDSLNFTNIKIADKDNYQALQISDETLISKIKGKAKVVEVTGKARITTEGNIIYAIGKNGEIVHDKHDIVTGDGQSYIVIK